METERSAPPLLSVRGLTKEFGAFRAVNDLDLDVYPGEIVGLLGPNGAGKSTLLSMVLGLLAPTSGEISLFGATTHQENREARRRMSYVPETQAIYDEMIALEYVDFFREIYGLPESDDDVLELFERLDLEKWINSRVANFSMGMKRRLGLIRAIATDPDLIVLDEPVANLDPRGIVKVRELLQQQRDLGRSVLVSSHLLGEIELLADRVIVMRNGSVVLEGTPSSIRDGQVIGGRIEVEIAGDIDQVMVALRRLPFVGDVRRHKDLIQIAVSSGDDHRQKISQCIHDEGAVVLQMTSNTVSLEDMFLTATADHGSKAKT